MLATSSPAQPLSVSKEEPLIEASMPTSCMFITSESHNMWEFFDRLSNLQLMKRLLHGLSMWVSHVMLHAQRKNWDTQNLLQQKIFFSVRKKHPPFIKRPLFSSDFKRNWSVTSQRGWNTLQSPWIRRGGGWKSIGYFGELLSQLSVYKETKMCGLRT